MKDTIRFSAVLLLLFPQAILLCNALAMPFKFELSKDNYQLAQNIIMNTNWFFVFDFFAAVAVGLMMNFEMGKKRTFRLLLIALMCLLLSLALYLAVMLPINLSTENWLELPGDWENLRAKWEIAAAARCLLNMGSFSLIIFAFLKNRNYFRVIG